LASPRGRVVILDNFFGMSKDVFVCFTLECFLTQLQYLLFFLLKVGWEVIVNTQESSYNDSFFGGGKIYGSIRKNDSPGAIFW